MGEIKTGSETASELIDKIQSRKAKICVIGLGYVGLPLAVEFGKASFPVVGLERDRSKVAALEIGQSYIGDVSSETVTELVAENRFFPTTDSSQLATADVAIICVPTPLRKTKEPDISYILAAAEEIKKYLHRGQLIILESTTYPGTTDEVLLPMLEETGLKIDEDFFLAFSPERVDPGNSYYNTSNIPKVVGGVTRLSTEVARLVYASIVEKVHPVSCAKVAETTKLLENTFRSVNIGLVNEIAQLCRALDIDTWEVIEAAATKPFGFMPFYPGPGLGGHCIPLDPHYLSWKARLHGFEARFIGLAEEVNSQMPDFVVHLIMDALNERRKAVNGSNILILGVAYKKDVNDTRESPALSIIEKLCKKGAIVSFIDPHVLRLEVAGKELESKELTSDALQRCDCAVIVTNHSAFDYQMIVDNSPMVIDTRNATRRVNVKNNNVVRL